MFRVLGKTGHWVGDCQNNVTCQECHKSGHKRGNPTCRVMDEVPVLPELVWAGEPPCGDTGPFVDPDGTAADGCKDEDDGRTRDWRSALKPAHQRQKKYARHHVLHLKAARKTTGTRTIGRGNKHLLREGVGLSSPNKMVSRQNFTLNLALGLQRQGSHGHKWGFPRSWKVWEENVSG